MKWEGTIALVTLGACLAGYAYFVESKQAAPQASEDKSVKFWDVKTEKKSLDRLTITDSTGSVADYYQHPAKQGASTWYYSKRPNLGLQQYEWSAPYDGIATLQAERLVEAKPKDLKLYGLDKPWLKVGLGPIGKPDVHTVLVGQKNPLDAAAYYAQIQGDPAVYLVADWKVTNWRKLLDNPPLASPSAAPTAAPAKP